MPAVLLRQYRNKTPPVLSLAPRESSTDWNSWTSAQQGGVLAASLLLFLFFFGLGTILWQRRRERKRKERRALKSRSRGRRRHSRKRSGPDSTSPPRKKRKTKRVKPKQTEEETGEDKFLMKGAVETPKRTTREQQPAENQDTPDRANDEADQLVEDRTANTSLDRANLRLKRRRERRREARRRAASGYSSSARAALRGRSNAAARPKQAPETP
ncbi:hypothetical protein TRV_07548 [Trichophyton verrucosum HKI 0517]|uniref:Uncharacterized protein n=1 Tax=Trichophyton verrucosum (strain HKI 0517) TaxID=663202 RepID=D4DK27_TRIVH|nr:uncharacterized protein TRV_07548 [Trichophyton verrucosum HKI 0517]EFE37803.1 hypothetical protein TRV_07548 [Trichophyton verrucosum HKI 0517]